jgi:4'-phosphopantetheinyl transferase
MKLAAPDPGITLWLVDLDAVEADPAILSPAELARMSRFHFQRDAQRFARARSELRRLMAEHVGLPPAAIRFREGAHGKPHLDLEGRPVPFSVSHSQARAIVAIGESLPIGVDIEAIRGEDPLSLEALARSVMAARELEAWLRLDQGARRQAFHALWAAKEACLKAIGCGLGTEPRCLDVGWEPQPRDVVVPVEQAHASVRLFPLPATDGCAAAVALLHANSAHLAS